MRIDDHSWGIQAVAQGPGDDPFAVRVQSINFLGPYEQHEVIVERPATDALYDPDIVSYPPGQVQKAVRARESGECAGVQAAILGATALARQNRGVTVHVNAPLTHGADSTHDLEKLGVRMGTPLGTVVSPDIASVSAHGNTQELKKAKDKGIETYDFTCIWVNTGHQAIRRAAQHSHEDGITTGIIYLSLDGRDDHPELIGTEGLIKSLDLEHEVVRGPEDVARLTGPDSPIKEWERVRIVSQTTNDDVEAARTADELTQRLQGSLPHIDTTTFPYNHLDVCRTVRDRQEATREMVRLGITDLVVVGSINSANTSRLVGVALSAAHELPPDRPPQLRRVVQVNSHTQLPTDLGGFVGIVSGASTKQRNVDGVISTLNPTFPVEIVGGSDKDRLNMPFFPPIDRTNPNQRRLHQLMIAEAKRTGLI